MSKPTDLLRPLGPRERQVMHTLYELGSASAREVLERLDDAPSYSTIRTLLSRLEAKGLVRHSRDGMRYLYSPRVPESGARRSELGRVVRTFFGGSPEAAALALLGMSRVDLPEEVRDELEAEIERVRGEGR